MAWQVHVYGKANDELTGWCAGHGLPLHAFAWREEHGRAGLLRDALYLIRPDAYVALADPAASAAALERYFAARRIRFA
jgi:hypothetical protein